VCTKGVRTLDASKHGAQRTWLEAEVVAHIPDAILLRLQRETAIRIQVNASQSAAALHQNVQQQKCLHRNTLTLIGRKETHGCLLPCHNGPHSPLASSSTEELRIRAQMPSNSHSSLFVIVLNCFFGDCKAPLKSTQCNWTMDHFCLCASALFYFKK
jgi:hypothetical protein